MFPQLPNPSGGFESQLSNFENYASDFHLADLLTPVSSNQAPATAPVQKTSVGSAVAGAVGTALFPQFQITRFIALVLGLVFIIGALFMFKSSRAIIVSAGKKATEAAAA